jgi:hypothetical protein
MKKSEQRNKTCEIYYVRHDGSFSWKWRHVAENGVTIDSREMYPLYYECVSAARQNGYQPNQKCL